MRIRKAVVTAAGWGTRFLPATKAQPKEMMPLVDKPAIQYVVEEAVASGIEQIILVTAFGKRAIEDHFDRTFELEAALEQRGDLKQLEEIRRISDLAEICYVRQKAQLGLGHAVLTARELIGHEPFAVLLPDDIIVADEPCLGQLVQIHEQYRASVLALERVAPEATTSYGIIVPRPIGERLYQILGLVEKPLPEEAPSNLGIVGRYVLTPEIFEALEHTTPGRNNEIQLTDGLANLRERQVIYGYEFQGTWYDAGTPLGLLKASVELALRRADLGADFRAYLRGLKLDRGEEP